MTVVYAKYNRYRLRRFQLETQIAKEKDKKVVIKKALTAEAKKHIEDIYTSYFALKEKIISDRVKLPDLLEKKDNSLMFEFIEGKNFDKILLEAFLKNDKDEFLGLLEDYYKFLNCSFKTTDRFYLPPETKSLFKDLDLDALKKENNFFYEISFMDPIFDNIILSGGNYFIIDNEWVVNGCLPVSFVFFRSLSIFYRLKYIELGIEDFIPFDEIFERYKFPSELKDLYCKMEERFQYHVRGESSLYNVNGRYIKSALVFTDILKKAQLLNDMLNSRSWKLTRPLRETVSFLRNKTNSRVCIATHKIIKNIIGKK